MFKRYSYETFKCWVMNLEFWESLNYGKKWIHEEKKSRQNKTTWTTMCENCMKHEKSKAKHDVSADTCANFRFESFSGPWDEAENKCRNKWMNKIICVQEMTYNYLWNSTDLLSCKIKCIVSVNSETVCVCGLLPFWLWEDRKWFSTLH